MTNRFFTIMIVPEKTSKVRRFVVPAWVVRALGIAAVLVFGLAAIMILDYWYVIKQIDETKELRVENRRLMQQVQIFQNKIQTVENTMDRIRTFTTRLKVITNIEEKEDLTARLDQKQPDAAANVTSLPTADTEAKSSLALTEALTDPESGRLRREQRELEDKFLAINMETLGLEQQLQDLYELLIDQKTFLAALPTRKPAIGYFTSGFGIRNSPFGGGDKMHEGLDIANHPGTLILSTAFGVVHFAGHKPGYGKTVIIDHGYGIETWYGHSRTLLVKEGDKIRRGQKIAQIGNSGRSTGPHVHYEVRVHGIPVDPLSYIIEE